MSTRLNPHVSGGPSKYSPLESLIQQAIMRMGHMNASGVEGQLVQMFIEWANRIVEDYNIHPYTDHEEPIEYYSHISQVREIPDMIMVDGLTAHYSMQQSSNKTQTFMNYYMYNKNRILYQRKFTLSKRHELNGVETSDGAPIASDESA